MDDPFRDRAPFMSRPARSVSRMNDCPECDHPVIYHHDHGCFAAPDCDCMETVRPSKLRLCGWRLRASAMNRTREPPKTRRITSEAASHWGVPLSVGVSTRCPHHRPTSRDIALSHATNCPRDGEPENPRGSWRFAATRGSSLVGPTGLEPVTSCVSSKRSSRAELRARVPSLEATTGIEPV